MQGGETRRRWTSRAPVDRYRADLTALMRPLPPAEPCTPTCHSCPDASLTRPCCRRLPTRTVFCEPTWARRSAAVEDSAWTSSRGCASSE